MTGKHWTQQGCTMSMMPTGQPGVMIPITNCWPDSYTLKLRDGEETGSMNVSREDYARINIGDVINKPARSK